MSKGLNHALSAGRLLIEARAQCKSGTWLKWLEANFRGSARTAQLYMQVSKAPEFAANAKHVAHLSFRQAIRNVAAKNKRRPHDGYQKPSPRPTPACKPTGSNAIRSRLEKIRDEHPEFQAQREQLAELHQECEEINGDYCRVQDEIMELESTLTADAKTWCAEHIGGSCMNLTQKFEKLKAELDDRNPVGAI